MQVQLLFLLAAGFVPFMPFFPIPRHSSRTDKHKKNEWWSTPHDLSYFLQTNRGYSGKEMRGMILHDFYKKVLNNTLSSQHVVDLGCGTGISTPEGGMGVDIDMTKIQLATLTFPNKTFARADAKEFGAELEFDVSVMFFLLSENSHQDRVALLENALFIAAKTLVVDFAPSLSPGAIMLDSGVELKDYTFNLAAEVQNCATKFEKKLRTYHYDELEIVAFHIF